LKVLIFGIASLIALVIYAAKFVLPVAAAYWIGGKTGYSVFRWGLPIATVVLPILWVYAGYETFKSMCPSNPLPKFFAKPVAPQLGYAVESAMEKYGMVSSFDARIAFRYGDFKFVDENGNRQCQPVPNRSNIAPCTGLENQKSQYVVKVLPWVSLDKWWSPPIYRQEYRIEEIGTNRVMALASELVFGGGLLSPAMRLAGGDQDHDFLACGYVSSKIDLYRPTLSTRKRQYDYQNVDQDFVMRALTYVSPSD